MRCALSDEVTPGARLFDRLVRDLPDAEDLAAFRNKVLESVAREIGADSGSLLDPRGTRLTPRHATSRVGMLEIDPRWRRLFVANRARYERSAERLFQAMEEGRPVIDSDVYQRRERERLDLYAEILVPQGATSMLCATVHHRGRALCQLALKRHGQSAAFRDRDAQALEALLPAVALADAGFQHAPALARDDVRFHPMCAEIQALGSREAEVAALVCKGMRNREIAMLIGTSCETVKKQVHNVLVKVGVSNRAELAGLLGGRPDPADGGDH